MAQHLHILEISTQVEFCLQKKNILKKITQNWQVTLLRQVHLYCDDLNSNMQIQGESKKMQK